MKKYTHTVGYIQSHLSQAGLKPLGVVLENQCSNNYTMEGWGPSEEKHWKQDFENYKQFLLNIFISEHNQKNASNAGL